jgi:hypothetical protein
MAGPKEGDLIGSSGKWWDGLLSTLALGSIPTTVASGNVGRRNPKMGAAAGPG